MGRRGSRNEKEIEHSAMERKGETRIGLLSRGGMGEKGKGANMGRGH